MAYRLPLAKIRPLTQAEAIWVIVGFLLSLLVWASFGAGWIGGASVEDERSPLLSARRRRLGALLPKTRHLTITQTVTEVRRS